MAGGINWDSSETWERMVAAIVASGVKLDLKSVAAYYGTTYDTLENRFRKIKKVAATLKAEVDGGERGEVATRPKSNPRTPRKAKTSKKDALTTVAHGRVTKASPNKKSIVKQEQVEGSASSAFDDPMDGDLV
ncbi:hypothetical protein LTR08_003188 [Meristemomyces frigidus]|nr:hypothetical protein LTR08_003188 [Meristemomyces frigidus]